MKTGSSPAVYLQGLHESFSSRTSDCTQIVYQVSLSHTDASVDDGQGLTLLIWDQLDHQIFA